MTGPATYLQNEKTGTVGQLLAAYTSTKTGKGMVEVMLLDGRRVHWLVQHVRLHG